MSEEESREEIGEIIINEETIRSSDYRRGQTKTET